MRSLVVAAALVLAPHAARAACPESPLVGNVFGFPGVGEANLPLNVSVLFMYPGTSPALETPSLTLFTSDGAVVPATVTELPQMGPNRHAFLLVPTQPLAPSTRYLVGDAIKWGCTSEPCTAPLTAKWPVTTGTETDTIAPLAPVPVVATQAADVCDDGSCCGPYHALITNLANPASGAVRYDLYDGGQLVRSDTPFAISTDCARAGDVPYPSPSPSVALAPGAHHLTLRAFDLANNQTIGTQALELTLACPAATPPDAGVPMSDAGHAAADDGDGGGCSTGRGGGSGAAVGLALAALVASRRRGRGVS